jgi:hypothetical protein
MAGSPSISAASMRALLLGWVRRELFVTPAYEPPWRTSRNRHRR